VVDLLHPELESERYSHLSLDLADASGLAAGVEEQLGSLISDPAVDRIGLANNAADPALLGPVAGLDPVEMHRVFAVNVVAPIWLMGWLVRKSRSEAALRIVNVSTGAAVDPFPGLATYASSKAALRMSGRVLATELEAGGRPDACVLSYDPGIVDTAMQAAVRASSAETVPAVEFFRQVAADGRLTPPEAPAGEIADFLGGDGYASFSEKRFAS
jgi:NAD(P)-dependent dehydrogenase (short-subunit alcohol dehydrogenase family)